MIKRLVTIMAALSLAAVIGCSGGEQTKDTKKEQAPVVAKLVITPATATVAVGATQEFTVAATDAKGKAVAGAVVTWKVTAAGKTVIGTLSADKGDKVVFTAKAIGKCSVDVESGTVKASAAVEVVKKKK